MASISFNQSPSSSTTIILGARSWRGSTVVSADFWIAMRWIFRAASTTFKIFSTSQGTCRKDMLSGRRNPRRQEKSRFMVSWVPYRNRVAGVWFRHEKPLRFRAGRELNRRKQRKRRNSRSWLASFSFVKVFAFSAQAGDFPTPEQARRTLLLLRPAARVCVCKFKLLSQDSLLARRRNSDFILSC